jgi:hypothetical protein
MAKATTQKGLLKNTKSEGKKAAKEAAYSPLMERLTRLGYGIKGVIYILIGLSALEGVFGKNQRPADQLGAIVAMKEQAEKIPAPVYPVEEKSVPEGVSS